MFSEDKPLDSAPSYYSVVTELQKWKFLWARKESYELVEESWSFACKIPFKEVWTYTPKT